MGAPSETSRKGKRNHEHDQPVIDVDTWLQEARHANDMEAMRRFTRTILHQTTTTKHTYKRPRTCGTLHHIWTSTLNRMEELTRRHLRVVTRAYHYASTYAHTMKHVRDLRSLHHNALGAKHLTTHIQDQICITRTHHKWQQHVSNTTKAYYATKRKTYTLYTKSATILGLYERLTRHLATIPFRRLPMSGTSLGPFAPTLRVFGRRTRTRSVCAPSALLDPTKALVPTAKGAKRIVGSVLKGSI